MVKISKENKVKRFLYASASSVYGIKEEKNVSEEMPLEPLTDYSKFKASCEEILNNYADDNFIVSTIRPATVCGYAPRQRLDVIVNILTNHAYHKKEILIFDESTSNLDNQNKENIISTINQLAKEKTIIIISHDESVIKNCKIKYLIKEKKLKKIN